MASGAVLTSGWLVVLLHLLTMRWRDIVFAARLGSALVLLELVCLKLAAVVTCADFTGVAHTRECFCMYISVCANDVTSALKQGQELT